MKQFSIIPKALKKIFNGVSHFACNSRKFSSLGLPRKDGFGGGRRLETFKVFGPVGGHPITQAYGRRGADENFVRGTGTFRSLHGGRMPAFNPP